ncbi:MAG: folate-binding protein YgfZ [Burkholderiaceae bacterium]|nr:folate-binding protein YgfZ [Burkholderiaceae bacterium]
MLEITGADAAAFLHAQLTNDIEHLQDGGLALNGYCTPKGRLLATFIVWRRADRYWLLMSRGLCEPVRKRLTMFVLRSKVSIAERSDSLVVLGIGGSGASAALAAAGIGHPDGSGATGTAGGDLLALPAPFEQEVYLLVTPTASLEVTWRRLEGHLAVVDSAHWRSVEIRAGVARVLPATSENWVPQMINFELVGGVSFKKGCYPGQEVVARSQYLGKLKRRLFAASLNGRAAPGDPVEAPEQAEPVGTVVLSATSAGEPTTILFEYRYPSAPLTSLRVGGADLVPAALPYQVPGSD